LWSYEHQIFRQFEIIIADDGSNEETKEFIKKYIEKSARKLFMYGMRIRVFRRV